MSAGSGMPSDDALMTCFFDAPPALPPMEDRPEGADAMRLTKPCRPAETPQTPCVSLRSGDVRIMLLCAERIAVGRHLGCELIPPEVDDSDAEARRRRLRVSRFHCEIVREGAQWIVRDGIFLDSGERRHSSFGTWWRGEQVADSVPLRSAPGTLTLGGPSAMDSIALDVRHVGESLLLSFRSDPGREYALLSGELDLGMMDPRLHGTSTFLSDGTLIWRRNGEIGTFVPGTRLPASEFWIE